MDARHKAGHDDDKYQTRYVAPMTYDDVRNIALAWPQVEDATSHGTPALPVRKRLLARLKVSRYA